MELIRYRPGEAIRWLQTGAQKNRKDAKVMAKSMAPPEDMRTLAENVKSAAGALVAVGRGAIADLMHHQASASEYVLGESDFEVIKPGSSKRYQYSEVRGIQVTGDRFLIRTDRAQIVVKPYAHVVAGRLKVPVGWSRNGIEVPYELLIEELSARGAHQTDIGDAFYEADPNWISN